MGILIESKLDIELVVQCSNPGVKLGFGFGSNYVPKHN